MYEIIKIPWPSNEKDFLWFAIGLQFGRSFGKKLDHGIQQGMWFNDLKPWQQDIVKRILDFTHHWWMGYILWCYAAMIATHFGCPQLTNEILWFGIGLLVDDLPDLYNRILDGIKNLQEYSRNGNTPDLDAIIPA